MPRRRGSKKGSTVGARASRARADGRGSNPRGRNNPPTPPNQVESLPVETVEVTDTSPPRDHRRTDEEHRYRHATSSQNRGEIVSIFPSAPPPDMVEQRYMNRFEGAQQYGNPYPQNAPPCPHPPYIPPRYPHPPYVQPPFPDPHVALPYPHPPHIMPFFPPFGPNHGPINPSQPEVVIKEEPQDFNGPPPPKRARGFNVDEILEDEDDSDDEVDDSDDDEMP